MSARVAQGSRVETPRGLCACDRRSGPASARGRLAVAGLVSALVLGVATTTARAQGLDTEVPGGGMAPGWIFTPSVSVGVSADDNPLLATRGNPRPDDVITFVRPSGQLALNRKHTHASLGYHGTLVRYRELDQFDNYEQRARLEVRHQPSRRLQLFVRNSYMDTPVTEAIQVAGVPFFRTGTRHNETEAGLSYLATRHLEVSTSYRFQWIEFDRASEPIDLLLQGGRSHGVMVDVRQRVSPRWRVGGSWDYRHSTLTGSTDVFDIQNAQAIVEWQASPTMVIEGGGGISYLALPSTLGTEIGPALHASLRKRTEYAFLTLTAARSFVPAFSFGGSLRNQEVSGSVRVPFARRAYVQSAVAWRDSQPVFEDELGVRAFWADVTVGYTVKRWLRVEAFYTGAFQDTTVAGGNVDRNRVGVQFVTSRPMRIE
jgi:hypothetical protein